MNGYKVLHGLPVDTKLSVIARRSGLKRSEVLALWITLLDYASQNSPRSSVENIDAEEIALVLELDMALVDKAFQALRDKGMISADHLLAGWEKSQKLSSTMRTREYRARHRQPESRTASGRDSVDADTAEETSRRRHRLRKQVLARKRESTSLRQC